MDLRDQLQASLGSAYTIERELGGGGMSRVFVAQETALGRQVVVKVLPPETAASVSLERFQREIMLAARLQHPHIVPLLSAGDAAGLPYFTMPFVEGESLRARLARHGELPVSEALRILREIAAALAYAHERGVVHRDIKPDNVLLSGGSAMVTDFGVAKALAASGSERPARAESARDPEPGGMTSMGVALGTPAYMSPEQASADPNIDHRADLYAFGALAYELLTGQPPFVGRTSANLLAAHVNETPEAVGRRRPALPPALAGLVMRCLEKRPADRPQSASEIVHALDDITTPSGGTQPTRAATSSVPLPARTRRTRAALLVGGVMVLAILALAARSISSRLLAWRIVKPDGTEIASSGTTAPLKKIAVLPFDPRDRDTSNTYLADGMATDLTTALGGIRGLAVVPRSSAFALRGKTAEQAGTALGADAVVEGMVGRVGKRLRVSAALVSIANDVVLWSWKYDVDEKEIFALHDSIASAIASALAVGLSPDVQTRLATPPTKNLEAHDLVLRARFLISEGSNASLTQSVVLAEKAISLDSTYADAWSALANSWYYLADTYMAPHDAVPHMRAAAERAIALDPGSAEARGLLGSVLNAYERQYREAESHFVRALALDSTDAIAGSGYAWQLWAFGHGDSALVVVRRAVRHNPLSQVVLTAALGITMALGPLDSATALCRRQVEISMDRQSCETEVLIAQGRYDEAVDVQRRVVTRDSTVRPRATLAWALGRAGRSPEALRELAALESMSRRQYVDAYVVAIAYVAVPNAAKAIEWLERALASDAADMSLIKADPRFASLRADPRFQSIVRRAGLP